MEDDNPFAKAQTVDPEVRAYVFSLVNALGGCSADEDGRYVLGDDALACLRDLKRWLKLYDEKTNRLDVARCLAEAKLVTGDLLPILSSWTETGKEDRLKSRVALACLEILVPLTWPLETGGDMTVNHHRHTPFLQQSQVLYKAGILGWDICSILRQIVRIGLPSIALTRDERTPRDEGIIKLMLYFVRNVTVIRQVPSLPSQGLESEVSRSATIEAFRQQDIFALLLTLGSNMGEDFNLQDVIVLEILFNLIKGVDVKKLWQTEAQRKGNDISELKATLVAENGLAREAKRNEQTRHGRFGTMIWLKREDEKMSAVSGQNNLRDGRNALFNMDKSKRWNKPQQRRKDLDHTIYDFDHGVNLTTSASEKLRNFVEEFLDSGFNPLFSHLRKAIEREAERLLDINYRQFFYTVAWFLEAERVRRQKQNKEIKPLNVATEFEPESYSLVASVLNQETFIMLNRYMQTSFDNKEWQDLNACTRCFTQILVTVQEMSQSPLDEDQEIAENIQNRIFYEETTHDRIFSILRGYKDQGFGYLDACTELSHVFLRVLERYSKENVDLQVRSRRRAKRKEKEKKQQVAKEGEDPENLDEESENEDIADVVQVSKERKFDFTRFALRFSTQGCVDTFTAFLAFYRDLSVQQLKRCHRFFYRVAFKQELAVLLYRVDIIALFYRMIKGPGGLDISHEMYREWLEFGRQVFKKLFKKIDQRPELITEMLFSKINATLYYLEFGKEKQTLAQTKAPLDIEVKSAPGRGIREQIIIVVAVLIRDDKVNLVRWLKSVLEGAWDTRHSWEAEAEARKSEIVKDGNLDGLGIPDEKETPLSTVVQPPDGDTRTAMFKNARLKLLMRLVGLEILGLDDAPDATWIIPAGITSTQLREHVDAIEESEKGTWQSPHANEAPEDLLRRVKNVVEGQMDDEDARRDAFIDDSEGNEDVEDFLFPDNIRTQKPKSRDIIEELKAKGRKRKRDIADEGDDQIDDAEAISKRKAREEAALERRRKIKSELYIRDSDEDTDEERDREFFQKEEEVRKRQEENIRRLMTLGQEPAANGKAKGKKNDSSQQVLSDDDMLGLDIQKAELLSNLDDSASSPTQRKSDTNDELEADEETPLSSQSFENTEANHKEFRSSEEISQPRKQGEMTKVSKSILERLSDDEEEEDEEERDKPFMNSSARPRARAGFIIDSDEDE